MVEKNKSFFENGEANEWFKRNKERLENRRSDTTIDLLANWLKTFADEITDILEIGCGVGHRLNKLAESLSANGFGVEPSSDAIKYMKKKFPKIKIKKGYGDNVPFSNKFDLVHLGFFLYLVDREVYLRCISEADRLVKFGGFLSILDFETPIPYSNTYAHQSEVFAHKQNNSDVFVASGLYSVVNKFQFSHSNFFFDKDINERISITVLYKETGIFGKN